MPPSGKRRLLDHPAECAPPRTIRRRAERTRPHGCRLPEWRSLGRRREKSRHHFAQKAHSLGRALFRMELDADDVIPWSGHHRRGKPIAVIDTPRTHLARVLELADVA